ncbi:MAG: FAD-dependent oxidoreductase [Pseudorhodoplanes sp.]|jgi:2,4-dienoyl-CoA reductase (NADPH2)|nr:FAD-dependent oxidoreductase [Pseudorhodoplanes sp.]
MTKPGEVKLSHLFQRAKWGRFELKNRVKYGACCVSNYNTRDGFITPRELARTKVIAETGCGMITNQGAYPDPHGEGKAYFRQVAIFDDKFLPQFEVIARMIRDNGGIAIQQILHAGRYGGIDLGYCIQPSVVPQTLPHFRPPREITKEQIRQTIKEHAEAAVRAVKAGFHGTEVTSFMGYLLATFNSRFTNQRTDEYGGSIENRGRFMRELIDSIKQATPDNPLIVRLNGAELMDRWGGNSEDECFELMQQAASCGVDMISVTVGWQEAPDSSIGRDIPPGHWNRLAARAKKLLPNTPIAFGVRLPDPAMANECIKNGEFDFWEVCRPLLADPQMLHKAAEDRMDEVRRCVGSLNCLSRLFRDLPYTCTMNPALGHEVEPEYAITPAAVKKQIMVVGAGPAGMEFAITASQRGHEVTVFDKSDKVGGALLGYAANDLANRNDLLSVISYYETMARKQGVELRLGTTVDPRLMREMLHTYDVAVIATGTVLHRAALPPCEDGRKILDALDVALGKERATGTVAVLGGGKVGLTIAESLATQGHTVTIIEAQKRLAGDVMPSFKWRHSAWVEELKIASITGARTLKVAADGVHVVDGKGENRIVAADTVIAASPRIASRSLMHDFEWMIDELHVCGDAVVPRGLGQSIHDGYRLGCRI